MKHTLFAIAAGICLTGCVQFTGVEVMPGDDCVDEENLAFAQNAKATYDQRQQFKRPVMITEAPGVNVFLSPNYVPRSNNARANALCQNIETRRTLLLSSKACLREIVSGLRDLELVGEGPAPAVSVSVDSQTPQVYHLTYNISNLDLQLRESQNMFHLVRATSSEENKIAYEWVANVTVELKLDDPSGRNVFTFNAIGTLSQMDDGSLEPNVTMLEQAATQAVDKAMKQYAYKFGPPIYVTQTCQNGEFACLSVGSDYGIRPGMRVEFIRHRERKALDGSVTMMPYRVGTGVIGRGDAPVQPGAAWAHVEDYDEEKRTVFQWTSAKLIGGEASTGSLVIPGLN